MQVNERGGYDYTIKDVQTGQYLAGLDAFKPEWVLNPTSARAAETEDEILDIAALYGFLDDDGNLKPEFVVETVPWLELNDDISEQFLDTFCDEDGMFIRQKIVDYLETGKTPEK